MLEDEYHDVPGDVVEPLERHATLKRMRGLIRAVRTQPRFHPLQLLRLDRDELLIVDVDLDVPQVVVHDVRTRERLAIRCTVADEEYPFVYALRRSFPRTPHQMSHDPRSEATPLCLFEAAFEEYRLTWNPTAFLAQVCYWLEHTARGTLHADDQPVEPLFYATGREILVPDGFTFAPAPGASNWMLAEATFRTPDDEHHFTANLLWVDADTIKRLRQAGLRAWRVMVAELPAREHGLVHRAPRTLGALCGLLAQADAGTLKARLRETVQRMVQDPLGSAQDIVLLIVRTPLLRQGVVSAESLCAFMFTGNLGVVAKGLDVATILDGKLTAAAALRPVEANADALAIEPCDVYRDVNVSQAREMADVRHTQPRSTVVLGVGAVGSHVVSLLARSGWERIAMIDRDHVRPHNLVRHVLTRAYVGLNKAFGMSQHLAELWPGGRWTWHAKSARQATADPACVIDFGEAELIVDCSASQPATRIVALDWPSKAQRISMFLTPDGKGGAVLGEDRDRTVLLDAVEAQYFRGLINHAVGDTHLTGRVAKHRYGFGCRDRSVVMPPDAVSLYSPAFTDETRRQTDNAAPFISVMKTADDGGLHVTNLPVAPSVRKDLHGWTVISDEGLRDKLRGFRDVKLPNETGGVLVGYYDVERRIVYVVDALPAPPDSVEAPGHFIRGSAGLDATLLTIYERTGGAVVMIGDWHSHPPAVPARPSVDDLVLLVNEGLEMLDDGLPGLIAILGDEGLTFMLATELEVA